MLSIYYMVCAIIVIVCSITTIIFNIQTTNIYKDIERVRNRNVWYNILFNNDSLSVFNMCILITMITDLNKKPKGEKKNISE